MSIHQMTSSRPVSRPWTLGAALLGAAVLAGGTTLAVTNPNASDKPDAGASTPDLKVEHAPVDRGRTPAGSFAPIVQKVAPSVVEVFVTAKPRHAQPGNDQSDLLRRFLRPGRPRVQFARWRWRRRPPQRGLGSGVIVSPDGYILTNNHVVKDASDIRVTLSDGRDFAAKVVGTDPKTDVAIVKIKADSLPALTFADSAEISVGDVVLAVGNPFGIGQTVTQGIVSAKNRRHRQRHGRGFHPDRRRHQSRQLRRRARLTPKAGLVGINSEIFSRSGGNQGIGFAIPSNLCQWVMTSLVKNGHVDRGFLGVSIEPLNPKLAHAFNLDNIKGALVADVSSGSPAENAGFKSGDVIRQFKDQPVTDASQFPAPGGRNGSRHESVLPGDSQRRDQNPRSDPQKRAEPEAGQRGSRRRQQPFDRRAFRRRGG